MSDIDKAVLNEIGNEGCEDGFAGEVYSEPRMNRPSLPFYKVWNPNPQAQPTMVDGKLQPPPITPGMVMTTISVEGDNRVRNAEITDRVRAVILFTSHGRKLSRGSGPTFQIPCQSHNGETPSLRIDQPLCRKTSAADVAQIISQWKNYDQAKVDVKVKELTGSGAKLQMCGLKASGGFINICPYSKKDPVTGVKGPCKQHIFLHCYDIDRKREFKMEVTGQSIEYGNRFISPYHEFFKFLQTAGPRGEDGKIRGLPCYAFRVVLSAAPNKAYYYLNISEYKPIESPENRADMRARALLAKEVYDKDAHRLSKEEYDRQRASENNPAATSAVAAPPPAADGPAPETPAVSTPKAPVSFDEDDIPF